MTKSLTRDQAAEYYAKIIMAGKAPDSVWELINLLILNKWSNSGLDYIKNKAWKIVSVRHMLAEIADLTLNNNSHEHP